jgi:hypothetical protein
MKAPPVSSVKLLFSWFAALAPSNQSPASVPDCATCSWPAFLTISPMLSILRPQRSLEEDLARGQRGRLHLGPELVEEYNRIKQVCVCVCFLIVFWGGERGGWFDGVDGDRLLW